MLEYLCTRPECGVVDFYGFSLHHDQRDAKIIVQICMELMRGGSLRDNLLVLKRKGQKIPLPAAYNIMLQVGCSCSPFLYHLPLHPQYFALHCGA